MSSIKINISQFIFALIKNLTDNTNKWKSINIYIYMYTHSYNSPVVEHVNIFLLIMLSSLISNKPAWNTCNSITLWYSHYTHQLCTSTLNWTLWHPQLLRPKMFIYLIINVCFTYACLMKGSTKTVWRRSNHVGLSADHVWKYTLYCLYIC